MITDYSRDEIKKMVKNSICSPQAVRDYEILQAIKAGKTTMDVSIEYNISERQIYRIKSKYLR